MKIFKLLFSAFTILILTTYSKANYVYHPEVGHEYKLYDSTLTWHEARKKCSKENASLAMPKNQKEIDVLTNILNEYLEKDEESNAYSVVARKYEILAGFHNFFDETEFTTLKGHSVSTYFRDWSPPKQSSTIYRCGSLSRSGNLIPFECSVDTLFVCQKETTSQAEERKKYNFSPDYRCADHIDKCYKISGFEKNWNLARKFCTREGGNLVIINNKAEERFVLNMIKEFKLDTNYLWIGIHDLFKEGEHTTVLDKSFSDVGYANWSPSKLSVTDEEKRKCVLLKDNGLMYEYSCDFISTILCERPAVTSSGYKYYPEVDQHYKLFKTPLNWTEARYQCAREKASLAFPKTQKEIEVLSRISPTDTILAGFHRIFGAKEYITLFGEPIQYYYGEQRPLYNKDIEYLQCGSLQRSGTLKEYSCSLSSPFVCQKNDMIKADFKITNEDLDYRCGQGLNKCYKIFDDIVDWHIARITCVQSRGNIVIIRNQAEERFVTNLIKEYKYPLDGEMWFGIHRFYKVGNFTTMLDEDFDDIGYANWRPKQPAPLSHSCVAIYGDGSIGMSHCFNKKHRFICERPAPSSSRTCPQKTQLRQKQCPVPMHCPRCTEDYD